MAQKVTKKTVEHTSNAVFWGSIVVLGFIIVTGAVMLGKSDNGEINVSATIQNSNQNNLDQGGDPSQSVGTVPDALRDLPNGGLVPSSGKRQDQVPPPIEEIPEEDESSGEEASNGEESTLSEDSEEGTNQEPDTQDVE